MAHNPHAELAIRNLLRAAVPERRAELDELWDRYHPEIEVAPDRSGTLMESTQHQISFDPKTLSVLWLLGFNAWHSIALYSPAIDVAGRFSIPIDDVLRADDQRAPLEAEHKARGRLAQDLITSKTFDEASWPEDIPKPGADRDLLPSDEEKASFDLVCMATAYVFLHEFRHVMLLSDGEAPPDRREEEMACDVWARDFMTSKIEKYGNSTGHSYEALMRKRSMAMALGSSIVHDITPEHVRWGTTEYPPIGERIEALVAGAGQPTDSNYWMFSACLLVSILRRADRPLPMGVPDYRKLVDDLIAVLR